ncbi:MAG: hypothetical protein JWM62_1527, partial [Frankiales bacterium]|nr:hypothetical protein [Frankiales bacterium]
MRLLPTSAARQAALRLAALVLALAATACSSTGGSSASTPAPGTGAVGAAATSSAVAELQAGLTALLVERTYLVAAATEAVEAGRRDGPASSAALAALDDGSVALADVLGATYREARRPLLDALRREDDLLARHAVALGAGDAVATAAVRDDLVEAQAELARIVRQVVPTLDAPQVAARLSADVEAQLPPRSYQRLHQTALGAADTGRLLAAGIAADRELGSPSTAAVRLRADLTGLLTEHVALVGALARELRAAGPGSASARAALQVNAEELAALL